jgi:uridine phosphorylase
VSVSWRAVSDAFVPLHLRPTAPLADRVLLPGDPGRALALAQVVLGDDRRMFNHHRGLWGYTGTGADGAPLTIQSTGMGGPSAAIVLEELARLGVRRAIRVGSARAIAPGLAPGALVVATEVRAEDGTSRTLLAAAAELGALDAALDVPEIALHPGLTTALSAAAGATAGPLVAHDLLYAPREDERMDAWRSAGLLAADLETAALAAVAVRHGVAFGAILVIAGDAAGARLDDEALAAAGEAAGRAAAAALAG